MTPNDTVVARYEGLIAATMKQLIVLTYLSNDAGCNGEIKYSPENHQKNHAR